MKVRTACIALAIASYGLLGMAATPRVDFIRTVLPPHDLKTDDVALIYAIGDSDKINTFLDVFYDKASRELRIDNAIDRGPHFIGSRPDEATLKFLRKRHPAAVYVGFNVFTCSLAEHAAEGNEHDVDNRRVRRRHKWADAICSVRVDIMDGRTGVRIDSFQVRGEGTSPRVSEDLTDEERSIAFDQAARYAALAAQQAICPRHYRESIELDESAPSFDAGMAMIQGDRLIEARTIWEAALQRHPDSAPLEYDLASVCEAAGDIEAANLHYARAVALTPGEARYRTAFRSFKKRNDVKRNGK
ncbi:MAG: tetratricopeptide repeat protein [Acidobacteriota bacterium]